MLNMVEDVLLLLFAVTCGR